MKNMIENPQRRKAVRAILLTPDGEILLMQAQEPVSKRLIWFTPGGGIEGCEDPEECLRRELAEETGLAGVEVGPVVWVRQHTFQWDGRWIAQEEIYHLVSIEQFVPRMHGNPSLGEAAAFRGFRWWTVEEIAASGDLFAPQGLSRHLASLVSKGTPAEPVDVGV